MNMNKILLVLIIASGFLLIFYANNDIFTRKNFWNIFQKDNETIISHNSNYNSNNNLYNYYHHHHRQHHHQHHHQLVNNNDIEHNNNMNDNNNNNNINNNNVNNDIDNEMFLQNLQNIKRIKYIPKNTTEYNIFVIYTKETYVLKTKFELFIKSLLKYTSVQLNLHIIADNKSEQSVEYIVKEQIKHYKRIVFYTLYDVKDCAKKIKDITHAMMPHFNSSPGSYYSDALFYLSLGLHRIVDPNMKKAILIDCDVVFRTDVKHLFSEFDKFSSENLFGLAPELTPVYRHILYKYRGKNPNTNFGNPYYENLNLITTKNKFVNKQKKSLIINNKKHNKKQLLQQEEHGYPGLNSGVILMDFIKIKQSKLYEEYLKEINVNYITKKYSFKGHLGDQDYYTLLGYEFPNLIYRLDCIWNRQLCTWWKENGYSDIFDTYFHCDGNIKIYHGNCNTRIPE